MIDLATTSADDLEILFVTGLHRSGTSALARVLETSPQIHGLRGTGAPEDEGQHVQTLVQPARAHGGPGIFAYDPGAHLTERSPKAKADSACRLLAQWRPYWPAQVKRGDLVLEKSPPTLVRTRFFQALFPGARFVVIVRHPGVVAVSTLRWRPELAPSTVVRHWITAHRTFIADRPRLRSCVTVRYEDLVAAPGAALAAVADLIPQARDVDTRSLRPDRNADHLQAWRHLRVGLDNRSGRLIERAIRPYGYSLDEPYVLSATAVV